MIRASGAPEAPWLRGIAVVGGLALAVAFAANVIFRETISPEIALAYVTFANTKSLTEALAKFLSFGETWYRPFTFYLTNHLLFQIIDIHNIVLIKAVSFCVIVVNAIVATVLARRLFASGLTECILTFSLIITHPLYYSIAFEGSGISDPIFTIFLNLFLIGYLTLLEVSNVRLGHSVQLSAARSVSLGVLCCLFVVGTVTSHERGLAIFPMAGILFVYYHCPTRQNKVVRWSVPEIGVFLFGVFAGTLYLVFVYADKKPWAGDHYRTGIELNYIISNIVKAFELPSRLLFLQTAPAYDGHRTLEFNLLALPLIACLVTYVVHVCRSAETYEKRRLLILTVLFLSSLPIPVLFGSSSWHFYTAAIYLSIATGRAVWFCLQKAERFPRSGFVIGFFVLLSISTVRGINEELAPSRDYVGYLSLVPRALKDKVLNDVGYIPEVVYYDTGSYGDLTWPFGGQGNLFKFLYRDPGITEIALVHGKVLASDQHLCARTPGTRSLAFQFDAEHLSWSAISARPCQQ
jgi:hypothetical protein